MIRELPHCDVNAATHCSMRCNSCSHASPFAEVWAMTPEMVARDFAALKPFVRFARIQMVGGEPTLNKQLPELIRAARESGVAREISVITNGKHLQKMTPEFWSGIDILQMSVYPTLDPKQVEFAKLKCAEFGKPFYATYFTEFHKQLRAVPNSGAHFKSCAWKSDCFSVHDGHFALCPQSIFFPKRFMGLDQFVDCLPLAGLTEEKFNQFLDRTEPLNACRICCANEMKPAPWSDGAKTEAEWIAASTLK